MPKQEGHVFIFNNGSYDQTFKAFSPPNPEEIKQGADAIVDAKLQDPLVIVAANRRSHIATGERLARQLNSASGKDVAVISSPELAELCEDRAKDGRHMSDYLDSLRAKYVGSVVVVAGGRISSYAMTGMAEAPLNSVSAGEVVDYARHDTLPNIAASHVVAAAVESSHQLINA